MPVIECGEALVAVEGLHARLLVDNSVENHKHLGYPPIFSVRQTVARKLVEAIALLPLELSLLVKESLRPASIQEAFFNRRLAKLSTENPQLATEQLIDLAARFIAPPWVGGHPSGGAIDVTLCDASQRELDLGCAYDEDEEASGGACISSFTGLDATALEHRHVLFSALEQAGFVNYPFEWWHWSYGDRYWAVVEHQSHAIYGPLAAF